MFFTADQANKTMNISKFNCLGFAIGVEEVVVLDRYRDPDTGRYFDNSPVNSFVETLKRYGIRVRQVSSIEETNGKTAFWLWGWYAYRSLWGMEYDDFHVARRNPDGSFEHKPDDKEPAAKVSLEDITKEYSEEPFIFVLVDD